MFDLSSLIRWCGPVVGMIRAQQQLARHARAHRPDVVFTIFDPFRNCPRAIRPEWIDAVIENEASIDPSLVWDPGIGRHATLRRLPRQLGEAFFWAKRLRRKLLSETERTILKSPGHRHPRAERRLRRLIKPRERTLYLNDDGSLRPCPPLDMVLDETLNVAPGDIYIGAQSDWYHTDVEAVVARQRTGLRRVLLCYDIIPILFPQWYTPADAAIFRRYYARAFATADRIIFNAGSNERDARNYCRSLGFDLADTRIVPLGSDLPIAGGRDGALPAGLEPGRFAVYVSTVEPRKNHQMLVAAWRRLKADGVIDARRFKLVFVGREGWMMKSFFAELAADPAFGSSILHLEGLTDDTIRALYAEAAFSLYPSIYEGYGLPPIESMLAGTPVIASSGGAIPEVVGDAGRCLDPGDAEAWYGEIRKMIEDEAYRRGAAERARAFRPTSWREAGERFFAAAAEPFASRWPSTADLKFPQHVRQTLSGTSNRKAALDS
jgi:glycosyltransferase involved in cell wall biosynthesis